jgi:aminoglycoside phosphotransferase (APT) family kinase protein
MPFRVERIRDRLAEFSPALWESLGRIEAILSSAEHLPPSGAEALVHGDLHFRHVLVEDGRLAGVIDWGDVSRADPALDLVLYWCFLPAAARTAFVDAYRTIPEDRLLRGRVLAVFLCVILLEYAHREGYPRIEAEAR